MSLLKLGRFVDVLFAKVCSEFILFKKTTPALRMYIMFSEGVHKHTWNGHNLFIAVKMIVIVAEVKTM